MGTLDPRGAVEIMSSPSQQSTARRGVVLAALAATLPLAECFHPSPMLRMACRPDHNGASVQPASTPLEAASMAHSRRGFLAGASLLVPSVVFAQAPAATEGAASKGDAAILNEPARGNIKIKTSKSLEQQMAVINFTAKIDKATDKAFKLAKKGDLKGAVKEWNVVIDVYEKGDDTVVVTPQATYRLGKSLGERGNVLAELGKQVKKEEYLRLAVADYKKAVEITPSESLRIKLAVALSALGEYKEAELVFGEVLKGGPGNEVKGRALNDRGVARKMVGDWEGAQDDFREAVEATRGSPEAVANYALVQYQLGEVKSAIDMLVGQVKSNPVGLSTLEGAEDIPAALAAMEYGNGDKEAALKDLAKVTDPRFRDLRYVKEGRLWPSKVVDALQGLLEEANKKK